jgi:hypothetical protein
MDKSEIEEVFKKYYEIYEEIKKLEKRQQKYKELIYDILQTENTNKLNTLNYSIEKKTIKSERINKTDISFELWEKYSKKSTYNTLVIKKKYSQQI